MKHARLIRTLGFLVCALMLLKPGLATADKKDIAKRSPASILLTSDPDLKDALPHAAESARFPGLDNVSESSGRKGTKYNRPLQTNSRYVYSSSMPPMYLLSK